MPVSAAKPCRKYGCRKYQTANGYCDEHQELAKRGYGKRQDGYVKLHDLTAWKKMRDIFKRKNPICAICGKIAVLVHHKIPVDDGGELLSEDNLQSLCRDCHEVIHGRKSKVVKVI